MSVFFAAFLGVFIDPTWASILMGLLVFALTYSIFYALKRRELPGKATSLGGQLHTATSAHLVGVSSEAVSWLLYRTEVVSIVMDMIFLPILIVSIILFSHISHQNAFFISILFFTAGCILRRFFYSAIDHHSLSAPDERELRDVLRANHPSWIADD
ncbi:hypothetical protein [Paracoccus tegillarcae]|uniref:hypothetical protein n=1 Tax=Paracoccus tegillarcae TaxID=1529068 RepID=UPI0013006AA1|nr:hypothetical protein [Paracoccus tegillarcae]